MLNSFKCFFSDGSWLCTLLVYDLKCLPRVLGKYWIFADKNMIKNRP